MRRRPRSRLAGAAVVLLVALALAGIGVSGASWAGQSANPGTGVTAGTVGTPGSVGASSTAVSCNPITISWTSPGGGVDDFRVEKSVDGGAWTTVSASTGDVTSINDATGYTNQDVQYRVVAKLAGTSWESAAITTSTLHCGVKDLAVTNPCSSDALTWTAANAATTYDIEYSTTGAGGPWTTLVTDYAGGTTYTDATQHTVTANVTYRVRPGIGAGSNGSYSNTPTLTNWQNFRVTSVTANNVTTLGTIAAGDNLVVNFSKPVATGTVTTGTTVRARRGGTKGLDIAGAATPGQIGTVTMTTNQFGASVTMTGTQVWSGGDTTWTWTWTTTSTTHTVALSSAGNAWSAGTVARCAADNSALKATPAPALAGRW